MNLPENEKIYIAGTCNIGKEEIARRRQMTSLSIFMCLLFILASVILHFSRSINLLIFFPFFMMFIGIIESRSKFCVYFGWKGIYNFQKIGRSHSVEEIEFIKIDRLHSLKLIAYSILLAATCTILFYFISERFSF